MSQYIPRPGEDFLSLPDFHDDDDLFDDDPSPSVLPASRRRIVIILSIVLLILLLVGIVLVATYRTHIVYQTKRITQGDLVFTFPAMGSLHTNIYTVNFIGNGRLASINVSIGQQVKKDQLLATLDPSSLQNALNEANASVAAARTALGNAHANYAAILSASQPAIENAQIQPLSPSIVSSNPTEGSTVNEPSANIAPQRVVPTPQLVVTSVANKVQETEAQGQITVAEKALALAQTKVVTAQDNLQNTLLKAPHAGTIASLNGVVGGEPATAFIQIVDPTSLQLQVNVNEDKIGAVHARDARGAGDAVSFSVDAYPGQFFAGTVATILPLSQSVSNLVTYPILITIVNAIPPSIHLLPGMTAHATITTDERAGVLVLPANALAFAHAQAVASTEGSVTHAQMQEALTKAKEMLQSLQQDMVQDNPAPAVVLERKGYDKVIAVPIVVGLASGAEYEVLDGLSADDVVLVGARTSSN